MAERGRPKSDNPRSEKVNLRLTPEEKARLEKYAKSVGRTKTQVLMEAFSEMEMKRGNNNE